MRGVWEHFLATIWISKDSLCERSVGIGFRPPESK